MVNINKQAAQFFNEESLDNLMVNTEMFYKISSN